MTTGCTHATAGRRRAYWQSEGNACRPFRLKPDVQVDTRNESTLNEPLFPGSGELPMPANSIAEPKCKSLNSQNELRFHPQPAEGIEIVVALRL